MGKSSKKKRKLNGGQANVAMINSKRQSVVITNSQASLDDDNQSISSNEIDSLFPNKSHLEITIKTLEYLQENPVVFLSKDYKKLRALLYQLHNSKGNTLTGRVSDALRDGRLDEANLLLLEMRKKEQVPKLGALQRWVRDCDAIADDHGNRTSADVLRTLDYILRTADPNLLKQIHGPSFVDVCDKYPLIMHNDWYPYENPVTVTITTTIPVMSSQIKVLPPFCINNELKSKYYVIYQEKGVDRKPANIYDMTMYSSHQNTINISHYTGCVTRIDVPKLPGAFVLKNLLSYDECYQIVSAAETIGLTPDKPITGSAKDSQSVLAHNFFWLVDNTFLNIIFERCKEYLPSYLDTPSSKLVGLNARWRLYRYEPGSVYRPHIDGAWPGSAIDQTSGQYVYDYYGDRLSKLTFLIRLNHGYCGGATTFFTPSVTEGVLDARPIHTYTGDVLVFPHGSTAGSLLHEGSAVLASNGACYDAKYVIRTDVLYLK